MLNYLERNLSREHNISIAKTLQHSMLWRITRFITKGGEVMLSNTEHCSMWVANLGNFPTEQAACAIAAAMVDNRSKTPITFQCSV